MYTFSFNILASYLLNINKLILKFIWRSQRLKLSNTVLRNNKVGGLRKSTSRFTIKLQRSSQSSTGVCVNKQLSGTEWKTQHYYVLLDFWELQSIRYGELNLIFVFLCIGDISVQRQQYEIHVYTYLLSCIHTQNILHTIM